MSQQGQGTARLAIRSPHQHPDPRAVQFVCSWSGTAAGGLVALPVAVDLDDPWAPFQPKPLYDSIPDPGCASTSIKAQEQWMLGGKKQKHKNEAEKGMWSWQDEKT